MGKIRLTFTLEFCIYFEMTINTYHCSFYIILYIDTKYTYFIFTLQYVCINIYNIYTINIYNIFTKNLILILSLTKFNLIIFFTLRYTHKTVTLIKMYFLVFIYTSKYFIFSQLYNT